MLGRPRLWRRGPHKDGREAGLLARWEGLLCPPVPPPSHLESGLPGNLGEDWGWEKATNTLCEILLLVGPWAKCSPAL